MSRCAALSRCLLATAICASLAIAPLAADEAEVSSEIETILANIADAGDKLIQLAEATGDDQFAWSPTDEVRTVSEVYMHVVGTNLLMPAALGAAPPEGLEMTGSPFAMMGEMEKTITSKADVVERLKASFEYVGPAIASITDLETEVTLFGPPASKRAYILIILAHAHEHLGQSIAYARSVGVVPPWSQPLPSGDDEGEGDGS